MIDLYDIIYLQHYTFVQRANTIESDHLIIYVIVYNYNYDGLILIN